MYIVNRIMRNAGHKGLNYKKICTPLRKYSITTSGNANLPSRSYMVFSSA